MTDQTSTEAQRRSMGSQNPAREEDPAREDKYASLTEHMRELHAAGERGECLLIIGMLLRRSDLPASLRAEVFATMAELYRNPVLGPTQIERARQLLEEEIVEDPEATDRPLSGRHVAEPESFVALVEQACEDYEANNRLFRNSGFETTGLEEADQVGIDLASHAERATAGRRNEGHHANVKDASMRQQAAVTSHGGEEPFSQAVQGREEGGAEIDNALGLEGPLRDLRLTSTSQRGDRPPSPDGKGTGNLSDFVDEHDTVESMDGE